MKIKALVWIGLVLQLVFVMFTLIQAPEPHAAIRIGIEQLQSNCPAQAPTAIKTAEGNWIIKTAGDFFTMADSSFQLIIMGSLCFTAISMVISIALLFALRKKKVDAIT